MNTAGKIAKYFAFGLAGLIIFGIITGIVAAVGGILMAVGIINHGAPDLDVDCDKYEKCISLSLSASDLVIKQGEKLEIESDNDKLEINRSDNKLVVKDRGKGGWNWFGHNKNKTVTVTLPKDEKFDMVGIAGAAGRITADKIITKDLKLDLGAGETTLDYVEALGNVKIDSGVGKFQIREGILASPSIHLGVGSVIIRAAITGNGKVDAGIGSVNLDLLLPESAYALKVEKGIGRISFNGSSVSDDTTIGNGGNYIDIDGGIGEITITTAKATEEVYTEKAEEMTEKIDSTKTEEPATSIGEPKD